MTPSLLIYIASGLLLFFAFGHAIGHFSRHKIAGEDATNVFQLMKTTQFNQFGKMRSFDENYTGMSFNLMAILLTLSTILIGTAIYLDTFLLQAGLLLIPISFCTLIFSITSWRYFFPLPAITCFLATICLIIADVIIWNK